MMPATLKVLDILRNLVQVGVKSPVEQRSAAVTSVLLMCSIEVVSPCCIFNDLAGGRRAVH